MTDLPEAVPRLREAMRAMRAQYKERTCMRAAEWGDLRQRMLFAGTACDLVLA